MDIIVIRTRKKCPNYSKWKTDRGGYQYNEICKTILHHHYGVVIGGVA